MMKIQYTHTLGAVPPGPGYIHLPIAANLGQHTGGPWYHPDRPNEIWKPLDCLPYPNCPRRMPTKEAAILHAADQLRLPAFPRNWSVIRHPNRHWLVRRRMWTEGFHRDHVPILEAGLRAFNRAGYMLHDYPIEAAIDPLTDQPFWLDLSSASDERRYPRFADDTYAWLRWLHDHGFDDIAIIRELGQSLGNLNRLHGNVALARTLRAYPHHYGTHCADLVIHEQDVQYLQGEPGDPFERWVLTKEPLPDYVADGTLLIWAWSPIHERIQ